MMTAPQQQKGSVLAISLIMLILLTMIGLTAMTGTTVEEKMAGNYRDTQIAFQSAEAALREAEAFIEGIVTTGQFRATSLTASPYTISVNGGTPGLYSSNAEIDYILQGVDWSNNNHVMTYAGTLTNNGTYTGTLMTHPHNGAPTTAPRFLIQHLGTVESDAPTSPSMGGNFVNPMGGTVDTFMIIARGTGGSDKSQVILRSYYGKSL